MVKNKKTDPEDLSGSGKSPAAVVQVVLACAVAFVIGIVIGAIIAIIKSS